ncbi:hypothetical protein MZTS_07415 [Methylorubrum zatmanii]|nr:hypothetical protein [Methylorubrum zatmanii]
MRVGARIGTDDSELKDLAYLYVTCDDCGHQGWWSRARLNQAEHKGFRSLQSLGSKFKCRRCVDRGGSGRNVSIRPVLREDAEQMGGRR